MPSSVVGSVIVNQFVPIVKELDQILPPSQINEKIKKYKVIHYTHYVQMFGFSVGLVTSTVTYLINDRPMMIASGILTITTGCALIGMKDLPYLKSLEENAQLIFKRVKKIGGFVNSLRQGNIQLESRTARLGEIERKLAQTNALANKSRNEAIEKLEKAKNELISELTKANEQLTIQTQQEKTLQNNLQEAKKELAITKKALDELRKEKNTLSTGIQRLGTITGETRRRAMSLGATNATLKLTVAESSKGFKDAKQHSDNLLKTISATDGIFQNSLQKNREADRKSDEVLQETKKEILNTSQIAEKQTRLLEKLQRRKKNKGKHKKQGITNELSP